MAAMVRTASWDLFQEKRRSLGDFAEGNPADKSPDDSGSHGSPTTGNHGIPCLDGRESATKSTNLSQVGKHW